ncbi:MAG: bestrophin family ion channel [Synechococcales bacterium]|nr:bestrophin family ion channel [Synechococcales bacterium]
MPKANHTHWFNKALQLRGSVIPVVIPRVIIFALFALGISWLDARSPLGDLQLAGTLANNVACNLVLGLLLVFRTNTAYDRFWEGRKAWGDLVVSIRSLLRELQTGLGNLQDDAKLERDRVLKYLPAFTICTQLYLQKQSLSKLATLNAKLKIDEPAIAKLRSAQIPPLEILRWLGDFIQKCCEKGWIDSGQRSSMNEKLNQLTIGLTTCERIQNTPVPVAYAVFLRVLIVLYCALLPFSLVGQLHQWTGLSVALISFVLLSVEAIGVEIENPFGSDANDLPLDELCASVTKTVDSALVARPYQAVKTPAPVVPITASPSQPLDTSDPQKMLAAEPSVLFAESQETQSQPPGIVILPQD